MSSKKHFQSQSLNDWLFYLEQQHPKEIELGLARVSRVAEQANLINLTQGKTVLVAGTNGKGTTIAFLEQYLLSLGHTVGVYSSPHMFTYHERVRINGKHLPDQSHVDAFSFIESKRGDTELTYFEFGTLAGFKLLQQADLDFVLIEVGLGGRLDATNIIDHDLAIVTSIGLDHVDWLGDDVNVIAFEKAGIFRSGKPAVVGEKQEYPSFKQQAETHNVGELLQVGKDFHWEISQDVWRYSSQSISFNNLYVPLIPTQNVATAITALSRLGVELSEANLNTVLNRVSLPGRMQIVNDEPMAMVDVAHNSHAINYLLNTLNTSKRFEHITDVVLVVAMMKDKDIKTCLKLFAGKVTRWYLGDITNNDRAAKASDIAKALSEIDEHNVHVFDTVKQAWDNAQDRLLEDASERAKQNETNSSLLLGVGSFYTVAEILNQEEV